jgi:small subunit ribosomal protein S4
MASASTSLRFVVRPGEEIQLTDGAPQSASRQGCTEAAGSPAVSEWLAVDVKAGKGTLKAYPQRSELPATLNEGLVVGLYSR